MDQFEEMSRKKQVVHAEKSGRGTSGKRTVSERSFLYSELSDVAGQYGIQ